jgi:hypothetical protein
MSVAENFSLFPLFKYFVTKAPGPNPNPNVGVTQPIASGLIENDGVNNIGGVTGNYTWYRLSYYGGTPNTQGVEVREYLIVLRGVSATQNNSGFQLAIPEGGFNTTFQVFKLIYNSMNALTPGFGSHVWTANIPDQ